MFYEVPRIMRARAKGYEGNLIEASTDSFPTVID
jgi:hypothetical protein